MGKDELRRALTEASSGPERDFTGTWAQGRRVRRRRQTAQGLGVVAVAAAAVGAFALGGGNLLGEDATIEPLPPATQTPITEEATDAAPTEADATEEAPTEAAPTETDPTEPVTTDGPESPESSELPGPDDPLPTTVEEYAETYLRAGMAGNQALLERMGTDGAIEASVTWVDLEWDLQSPTIREDEAGEVLVDYLSDGPNGLTLRIDRAAAESGAEDAVLHGETGDAVPAISAEEYADEVVRILPNRGPYASPEANDVLQLVPEGAWERTGSTEQDGNLLVTYEQAGVEGVLTLTVDLGIAEAREFYGVVDATYDGGPRAGLVVLPNPCDEPTTGLTAKGAPDATPATMQRAQEVLDLASSCDLDGLIALAQEQGTTLAHGEMPEDDDSADYGVPTPAEAFSGDEGRERAHVLATLLANYPPELGAGNDGPVLSATWPALEYEQWPELISLGIATQDDLESWELEGDYLGWWIHIEDDGTWTGMVEGR